MPFNGDYYDNNREIKNLVGEPAAGTGRPNDNMSPFNGDFYAGDGSVHNISELAGGGGVPGPQGPQGPPGPQGPQGLPGPPGSGEFVHPDIMYNNTVFTDFMSGFIHNATRPVFEPVYYQSVPGPGQSTYAGAVYAPNGKVIFVPYGMNTPVGIYDPATGALTNGPAHGQGPNAYTGGVLAPNGKIIFIPASASNFGIYDPYENTFTAGAAHGLSGTFVFRGGVLAPDGRIICVPRDSAYVGIYDPEPDRFQSTALGPGLGGSNRFRGGVLASTDLNTQGGCIVVLAPYGAAYIGLYDPASDTYMNGPAHGKSSGAFQGGALAPDGRVILAPANSANIGIYDPVLNTYTDGPEVTRGDEYPGAGAFEGAVLMPDGKIIFIPHEYPNIGLFDPALNEYMDGAPHGIEGTSFWGGALVPSGKVVFVPGANIGIYDLMGATVAPGYCLHPYLNKL